MTTTNLILAVVMIAALCLQAIPYSRAVYLPGVAPRDFMAAEEVELKVNKLSSIHTQLPFDYYSLNFCKPLEGIKPYSENLGEFLRGDRIENSAYDIFMMQEEFCRVVCQVDLKKNDVTKFKDAITNQYHHNWIVDNLPAASIVDTDQYVTTQYVGFPVGYTSGKSIYVYNHANIILEYHKVGEDGHRIVGFYVEPLSVKHTFSSKWDGKGEPPALTSCSDSKHLDYDSIKEKQIVTNGPLVFTYGVEWRESEVHWASRWDVYLTQNHAIPDKVHWFSIVNSVLIVLFLAFMVAMILLRTLNKDISKYNRVASEEDAEENDETGWKLIHADVFRPPTTLPMLFCVIVGSGVQLFSCSLLLIVFAAIGFLSPSNRGSIMIAMLLFFVLLGFPAGFTSARLYKTFKGKQFQRCTILTATLFPGFLFAVFFSMDILVWSYGSTGAVPLMSMIIVLTLWFGISVPLVFWGAFHGYKKDAIEFPVNTSPNPRNIPEQPWYLHPVLTFLLGGILPFGACFVELFFIMSSIWMDQYYYVFGFLLLVFGILVITCAEISIVLNYFQLVSEDYNWWWRSILTSGSTAFYVFLYSIAYFSRLEGNMSVTYCLYFGYMGIISLGVFLVTGSIGFFSCLYFNHRIYASIKVD
jgi:transmembrane 9 superfamily protein 2/4